MKSFFLFIAMPSLYAYAIKTEPEGSAIGLSSKLEKDIVVHFFIRTSKFWVGAGCS